MKDSSSREKVIVTGTDAETVKVALGYLGVTNFNVETLPASDNKESGDAPVLGYATYDYLENFAASHSEHHQRTSTPIRLWNLLARICGPRREREDLKKGEVIAGYGSARKAMELFRAEAGEGQAVGIDKYGYSINLDTLAVLHRNKELLRVPNFGAKMNKFVEELLVAREAESAIQDPEQD